MLLYSIKYLKNIVDNERVVMSNLKKSLGKRIQYFRKQCKLTQEQLAENIGIETSSLSNIECGKYYPTAENLEKIACALKTTPQVIFQFEEFKEPEDILVEINTLLRKNPDKIKDIYKILKALTDK